MRYENKWIRYANHAPIPFWMRSDPANINEYCDYTTTMLWVYYSRTDPQEWMKHDPKIQDRNGYTISSHWIITHWNINVNSKPPKWMYYKEE